LVWAKALVEKRATRDAAARIALKGFMLTPVGVAVDR
jgi:hypothetical protein